MVQFTNVFIDWEGQSIRGHSVHITTFEECGETIPYPDGTAGPRLYPECAAHWFWQWRNNHYGVIFLALFGHFIFAIFNLQSIGFAKVVKAPEGLLQGKANEVTVLESYKMIAARDRNMTLATTFTFITFMINMTYRYKPVLLLPKYFFLFLCFFF